MSLHDAHAATHLPVQDLDLARRWYADKLDLHPTGKRPGHLIYRLADSTFTLYNSAGTLPGTFSQMALQVTDLRIEVARLAAAGVVFTEYPAYGMTGPVAELVDEQTGRVVEVVAWFHDPDRNLISLYEMVE